MKHILLFLFVSLFFCVGYGQKSNLLLPPMGTPNPKTIHYGVERLRTGIMNAGDTAGKLSSSIIDSSVLFSSGGAGVPACGCDKWRREPNKPHKDGTTDLVLRFVCDSVNGSPIVFGGLDNSSVYNESTGFLGIGTSSTKLVAHNFYDKPNIIFIVGDDIGFEVPHVNGGQSYTTPNIDYLANNGVNFSHCEASPLCATSRMMLLTGKYNSRNYSIWGWMNNGQKTIGNLMQNAGYKTGFFGKLQLFSRDSDIVNMGFEKYTVFGVTDWDNTPNTYKYKNPVLYSNGEVRTNDSDMLNKFGDDVLTHRLFDFIDSNKTQPFFAYYPMALCHEPFSPTPDDAAFANWNPLLHESDSSYFPSMVKYMDKKIGQIIAHVRAQGLEDNTIIVFLGDNGTPTQVTSLYNGQLLQGGKGHTTEAGTHVPLMVYWENHIIPGNYDGLVDFTDFFKTLADVTNTTSLSSYGVLDGRSFYPALMGLPQVQRDFVYCHFDPNPDFTTHPRIWVQNKGYKLYDSSSNTQAGNFYNLTTDANEKHPLKDSKLTPTETALKLYFLSMLDTLPFPTPFPVLSSSFANNITESSATIGANIVSTSGVPLIQRGTLLAANANGAGFSSNRVFENTSVKGNFQQTRNNLWPQTPYAFTVYAMNANKSNNTGFIQDSFITSSNPPTAQPTSLYLRAGYTCSADSISLTWNAAKFPYSGATKAGYLLVYSIHGISLVSPSNRKNPADIVKAGCGYVDMYSTLPNKPPLIATLLNNSHDSGYYFMLIPYTWNGVDSETHNYLTNGALTYHLTCGSGIHRISALPVINSIKEADVKVYPNPTQTYFNLVAPPEKINVKVFDIYGKSVDEFSGNQQSYSFGQNYISGTYIVQIIEGIKVKNIKVVKAR